MASGLAAQPPEHVTAGRPSAPIRIDGVLDEPAWRDAGVIPDLVQQSPKPGEPTPYRTEVRALVSDDTLYFGFTCIDPEPGRIAVHTMQRDGDMTGDDSVAIVLDTFGDRTGGYDFRVDVAGARQDGLIANPDTYSLDWDGIWEAAVRRTPTGWTAEVAIPSRTLRFAAARETWGMNIERYVPRDRTSRGPSFASVAGFATSRRTASVW